jgi:polyisoprenoid-binding protein YceI
VLLATEAGRLDERDDWARWLAEATFDQIHTVDLPTAALMGYSFFKEPEAASGAIEAIPIAEGAGVQPATTTAAPTAESSVKPAATERSAEATPAGEQMEAAPTIFAIVPAESQARFLIDEVLRGSPLTVVGSTDQVAGQLAVDPARLSTAQVGTIQVNARTLATDNEFRNRAIKNRILLTDNYEYVIFTPTEISGLPASGQIGEPYVFQIVGDLTITDVTRQVTFDVTAQPVSTTHIEGPATTAFPYADFRLSIPKVPSVDTMADEVRLEFDFVAKAVE